MRRAVDAAAALTLGASYHWLDFLDAIYRDARYAAGDGVLGPKLASDAALEQRLAAEAVALWRATKGAKVFLPLAIGGHIDHRLSFSLGGPLAGAGAEVSYYEDFPYVTRGEDMAAKRRAEISPSLEARTTDVTDSLGSRLRAVACYGSQTRDDPSLKKNAYQYAARVAREAGLPEGRLAERVWVAPGAGS
jgi:LmbE family N-acetylglucosaminyl deacetylase